MQTWEHWKCCRSSTYLGTSSQVIFLSFLGPGLPKLIFPKPVRQLILGTYSWVTWRIEDTGLHGPLPQQPLCSNFQILKRHFHIFNIWICLSIICQRKFQVEVLLQTLPQHLLWGMKHSVGYRSFKSNHAEVMVPTNQKLNFRWK